MTAVAIQGGISSYSYEAAETITNGKAKIIRCVDFASVFTALSNGAAEFAVLPVRNKIIGEIAEVAANIHENKLKILGELRLPIDHILASTPQSDLGHIRIVRSHPAAIKQCRNYLKSHPNWRIEHRYDTAGSLQAIIADDENGAAAICSRKAAEIFNGKILDTSVADDEGNWTLFQMVSL
jgi:prephenate dehydratase